MVDNYVNLASNFFLVLSLALMTFMRLLLASIAFPHLHILLSANSLDQPTLIQNLLLGGPPINLETGPLAESYGVSISESS